MNFKSKAAEKYSVVRQTLVGLFSSPKHKKAKILDTVWFTAGLMEVFLIPHLLRKNMESYSKRR